MNEQEFALDGSEFIELNKLLKIVSLVQSGGEAKMIIKEGEVQLNGVEETRVRCKIRKGDVVQLGDYVVKVV